MVERFLFTYASERLFRKIILADNRGYRIRGAGVRAIAAQFVAAKLVTIAPIPSTCGPLEYFTVWPTAEGRRVWRQQMRSPVRKPRGGANRCLSDDDLRATLHAIIDRKSVSGAAVSLRLPFSTVATRLQKAKSLTTFAKLIDEASDIIAFSKRSTHMIEITDHKWLPNANPRLCDKLEVFTSHNGKESWYMLDISGGKGKNNYRVQSAMCIPFGTRASPRNVTGKMPQAVTAWVNDFLATQNAAAQTLALAK
jgi:hypothetical protein